MAITQNGALKRDDNDYPVMGGTSSSDNATIINSALDPVTRRLLVDNSGGGSGTVTSVSVVSANGFAGTVATATTTPAITLSTTITGILKGDGTAISAASASTDYAALAFKTISVSGQSDVVADSPIDTLTLVGSGITITTNASTDTITFTGGASGLTIGTTTITSGTTTRILYDNAGVLGEYTITGTGTVVAMQTSPQFSTGIGVNTGANSGIATTIATGADNKKGIVVFANSGTQSAVLYEAEDSSFNTVWTVDKAGAMVSGLNTISGGKLTLAGSTSGTGVLQVAAAAGSGIVFQLPSSNGSNTNFLQTNGSGVTSWAALPTAASITVGTTTIASGTTTRILYDNAGVLGEYTITGSGTVVAMQTSPTLVTPILGVATATSVNGLTITTTTGTFTLTNAKTLAVTNTLTLSGTDSTTMTFPSTTATIARTDAAQTFTGTQTFSQIVTTNNAITASGNAATVPITSRISTVTNNSAATLTITITTTSAVDGMMVMVRILDFSAVAQTITWVNTENSTVTAPTTSNGSTTLPLTVGFQYNNATSKWRCIASA